MKWRALLKSMMKICVFVLLAYVMPSKSLAQALPAHDYYEFEQSEPYQQALVTIQKCNFPAAKAYLKKEINLHEDHIYAYNLLGFVLLQLQEYQDALTAVDKAIELTPEQERRDRSLAYHTRASIHARMQTYEAALIDATMAISLQPAEVDLYETRAQIYAALGRYDLSDNDYDSYSKLDTESLSGYEGRAHNAMAQQQYRVAVRFLEYIVRNDASYWPALADLAECHYQLKAYSLAQKYIEQALTILPGEERCEALRVKIAMATK